MAVVKFQIDEKSLFYGPKNDFKKGHSATVATPVNQAVKTKKYRVKIMELYKYSRDVTKLPAVLVDKCLTHTTSDANSDLSYLFTFDKFQLDGKDFECDSSFGMYVKTEIDEYIKKRGGGMTKNTHLGREKLHYPITFKHKTDGFNIDNERVLKKIMEVNGGFSFVVRGFEYNPDTGVLNFLTVMIGLKGILLSTVFRIKKGVGKKLLLDNLLDNIDLDAQDISIESGMLISTSTKAATGSEEAFNALDRTRVQNGKIGEKYVYDHIKELFGENITDVYHTSKDYPTSPYDIEYMENGVKKYVEVKATDGTKKIFNMSCGEIRFMEKYKDTYVLILVSEVKDKFPKTNVYTPDQIMHMTKTHTHTRFFA